MVMMRTGDESCVRWDTPGHSLIPEKVDLYFESKAGKLQIIKDGVATDYSEEEATKILSEKRSNSDCRCEDGRGDSYRMGLRSDL